MQQTFSCNHGKGKKGRGKGKGLKHKTVGTQMGKGLQREVKAPNKKGQGIIHTCKSPAEFCLTRKNGENGEKEKKDGKVSGFKKGLLPLGTFNLSKLFTSRRSRAWAQWGPTTTTRGAPEFRHAQHEEEGGEGRGNKANRPNLT